VGKNPICALNIEIAPSEVDINVHPQKAELRFVDEARVMSHIIRKLGDFLATTPWLKPLSEPVSLPKEEFRWDSEISPSFKSAFDFKLDVPLVMMPSHKFSELRVIGQVQATYLLLESHEGLVVVDQHAAHERVRFEKIRGDLNRQLASQALLIPLSLELKPSEMALVLDHSDELYRLGIEAEPFGDHSIVIRALPDFIRKEDARALFLDVLAELANFGRSDSMTALYDSVCATLACHSSLRAGQRLNNEEIGALLHELDGISFNAHCPHGRPVVKSVLSGEMKKWFHRT
jgi:DNA mismatch repair protein MutL